MNVSLLCQLATWTFRTFGRFDTRTFGYLPGRFATCLKVCSLRYCKNFTILTFTFSCYIKTGLQSLSSGCETSREVANCPGIEMSKGSKRPGGEASMQRTVLVANRLRWQRNVQVVNWQSSDTSIPRDQRRLLFWQKMLLSDNAILLTLSRSIMNQFVAIRSQYGIITFTMGRPPNLIRSKICYSFASSVSRLGQAVFLMI